MIKRGFLAGIMLVVALLLVSCGVPTEDYEAVVAERDAVVAQRDSAQAEIASLEAEQDTAQAEIASLEAERDMAQSETASLLAEIEDLQGQIDALTARPLVEEAWNKAQERYVMLRRKVELDPEELVRWLELPDEPGWLGSARLSSVTLVDEPSVYEAVCIVTIPYQRMFAQLYEYYGETSIIWRDGNRDYEVTIIHHENGEIHRVTMKAGESQCNLTWTAPDGAVSCYVEVNESWKLFRWSNKADELVDIYSAMTSWLGEINEVGGLVAPSDQSLMFLALGELSKPPRTPFVVDEKNAARRVAIGIFHGVPSSCY